MQTNPTSPRFHSAAPGQASKGSPAPQPDPQDRYTESSSEHSSGWKLGGALMLGLVALGGVGTAQAATTQSQPQPRTDVGRVTGVVLPYGKVDASGTIRNNFGLSQGRIKQDGTVTSPWGIGKGRVDADGTVRGVFGVSHGRVEADGTVRNVFGLPVGRVKGADDSKIELQEKGGAALLLLLEAKD